MATQHKPHLYKNR